MNWTLADLMVFVVLGGDRWLSCPLRTVYSPSFPCPVSLPSLLNTVLLCFGPFAITWTPNCYSQYHTPAVDLSSLYKLSWHQLSHFIPFLISDMNIMFSNFNIYRSVLVNRTVAIFLIMLSSSFSNMNLCGMYDLLKIKTVKC